MATRQKKEGRERDRDKEKDKVPTTQKTLQSNQNAKLINIMSTFSVSKPTNVDAQRIVTILENLIEKVKILQYLDAELMNGLNDKNKREEWEDSLLQLQEKTLNLLMKEAELESELKPLLNPESTHISNKQISISRYG